MTAKNINNPYDSAIADLKAKREAIDSLIEQLEQVKAGNPNYSNINLTQSKPIHSTEITEDTFFNLNVAEAVRKYLDMVNRTPKTTKEIYTALTKGGSTVTEKSLYVIISRESREGKDIVKVNKKWGLANWYKSK